MRVAPGVKLYGTARRARVSNKSVKKNKPSLRKSLLPGTVVILLTGRYAGKHAVFVRQLKSGLIMVSGPFKQNGVPLMRVQQTHVIPTKTRVKLPKNLGRKIKDSLFIVKKHLPRLEARLIKAGKLKEKSAEEKRAKICKSKRSRLTPLYANLQKRIDGEIKKAIHRVPHLGGYIKSSFSLKAGDRPHEMVF